MVGVVVILRYIGSVFVSYGTQRSKNLFYATDTKLCVTRFCSWKIEETSMVSNKEFDTLLQKSSQL